MKLNYTSEETNEGECTVLVSLPRSNGVRQDVVLKTDMQVLTMMASERIRDSELHTSEESNHRQMHCVRRRAVAVWCEARVTLIKKRDAGSVSNQGK